MHWYNLRAPSDAQWEIQQYAKASLELVKQKFPIAIECFEEIKAEEEAEILELAELKKAATKN
jgi:thymidylate synthase ThyX